MAKIYARLSHDASKDRANIFRNNKFLRNSDFFIGANVSKAAGVCVRVVFLPVLGWRPRLLGWALF
jgi:hypothetical protein